MDAAPPRLAVDRLAYEPEGGAGRRILDDISFDVPCGKVFTVLGPSGSGKSTLLRCVNRLVEPTAGRVLLDGQDSAKLPVEQVRRRVGMVFQAPALFEGTVLDNVLYGPRLRLPGMGPRGRRHGPDTGEQDLVARLLSRVGLPATFRDKPVQELSGGEAQRVCLARALANDPEVLLLDEPTAALDPTASQMVEDLLAELSSDTDLTFVFVTHNLAQARRIGDHGLLLVDGHVVDQGELPEFLEDPRHEITRLFVEGRLRGEKSPQADSRPAGGRGPGAEGAPS